MNTGTRAAHWTIAIILVLFSACGGGGSGGDNPPVSTAPDVAGQWQIDEALSDNCGGRSSSNSYIAEVTQTGAQVVVTYGGISRSATLNGNELAWSGSYPEEGGTTTVSSLILNFSGNTVTGSATWSWTDGTQSCNGTSSITGTRLVADVPATPSGLNAVATSSGSIDLMWQDNADNEDEYIVERSAISATTDFAVAAVLPADRQSFRDTSLTPASTYYYRVASANAEGQSAYSSVASATTDAPPTSAPAAPSGLNGSATSSTSVQLFWIDNAVDESAFEVFQALGASGAFSLARTFAANTTSAEVDGLNPGTTYAFKVVATNSAGSSLDSNVHQITTPVNVTVPDAPTNPSVDSATSNSLTLRWEDRSNNETGFRIYRSLSRDSGYSEIAVAPPSSTSYTNTGLSAATTYWYRVSAFNDAGESASTTPVSGRTDAAPITPPTVPTGLTVGSPTSNSLTLNWTDTSDNETGFRVLRSLSANGGFSEVATIPASTTSYVDSGLNPSTSYWYRLTAFNSAGESAQTRAETGTTLAPPIAIPEAPTNARVEDVTANSATLLWTDNADDETGFQIGTCDGFVSVSSNGVVTCQGGFAQFAQVGPNTTSSAITGLQANTRYDLFVRAFNAAGNSGNTGVRFTTALGQQTVTLAAVSSNVVISNSLDGSQEFTAYPNSFPTVGINWDPTLTGYPSSIAYAGLVKYDLSSLQGRNIQSAILSLEANSVPVGFATQNFDIGTIATAWNASTVTWNQAEDFLYYNAGWQRNIPYPTFPGRTYEIDLTTVVDNWVTGAFVNNGLGFFSSNYTVFPGNIVSLDAYDFFVPTLTVTFE